MVFIIPIAVLVLVFSAIARARKDTKQAREINRLNLSEKRMQEEQIRFDYELRQRKLEAEEETRRLVALEREQLRLARESERHSAMLRKHDEEIEKLKFRMDQAESDIEHWKSQVGNLYALLDLAQDELDQAIVGGKNQAKAQKKIITLNNQIHAAESRLAKAEYIKAEAKRKLVA